MENFQAQDHGQKCDCSVSKSDIQYYFKRNTNFFSVTGSGSSSCSASADRIDVGIRHKPRHRYKILKKNNDKIEILCKLARALELLRAARAAQAHQAQQRQDGDGAPDQGGAGQPGPGPPPADGVQPAQGGRMG